jgi:hypothetical protein
MWFLFQGVILFAVIVSNIGGSDYQPTPRHPRASRGDLLCLQRRREEAGYC